MTNDYRAQVAAAALAAYDQWVQDGLDGKEGRGELDGGVRADLASSARWLLEALAAAKDAKAAKDAAGPRATGQANTAIRHLDTRGMRDVLGVLALRVPAAVLDAVAEAGHGRA